MAFFRKVQEFLNSKKWYMTIIGSALVMVLHHFGFPDAVLAIIGGIFGTYVVGQGVADINKPK